MPTPEINAGTTDLSLSEKAPAHSRSKRAKATKKLTLTKAVAITPKEVRIIVEQTIISALFILADMLIVWLVGLAFVDTMKDIPFIGYLYDGVKIASVLVITIRYLLNCIVDMNRSRKELISELKLTKPSEDM